ncbi:RHS repeat-associated core domain-containing protein, partial [Vibrio cionasavignyae]|uniref:RHS repeat-associated core domain-containing protein n=1 Tax=Vibrio cionasavignyae TaxID=2910252 RepID=UPI003D100CDF
LGRFLSADPFIQEPYLTNSFNRYSYVMNNPLKYTDPSGYWWGSSSDSDVEEDNWEPSPDLGGYWTVGDSDRDDYYTRNESDRNHSRISGDNNDPNRSVVERQDYWYSNIWEPLRTVASVGIGFTPLGTFLDVGTALTGYDILTGESVTGIWRAAVLIPGASELRVGSRTVESLLDATGVVTKKTPSGGSPALKGDPYHPDTVAARQAQNRNLYDIFDPKAAVNELGYGRRIAPQKAPFNSHGQPVFSNGKGYISPDVDGHNVTNGWKMFDNKGRRTGNWNSDLTKRIKD